MSLYKKYVEEIQGKDVLELNYGFIMYSYGVINNKKHCYIEDIYIIPNKRNQHNATELANCVITIAKEKDCVELYGSVNTNIKCVTRSMKVLMSFGMEFSHSDTNKEILYFKKEI